MAGSTLTEANDRLLARLRERIADPERRVDSRRDEFTANLTGRSVGDLFSLGRSAAGDLRRLLDHGVDAELHSKADEIERQLGTPATSGTSRSPAGPQRSR
jgi:hypothetical protein